MKRIGIAASRISKGNLFVYNLVVVLLSFLFSLFIFLVSGCAVLVALTIIAYISGGLMPVGQGRYCSPLFTVCMASLTVVVTIFTLMVIMRNLKIRMPGHSKGENNGV